jgi:hypothetical protein
MIQRDCKVDHVVPVTIAKESKSLKIRKILDLLDF